MIYIKLSIHFQLFPRQPTSDPQTRVFAETLPNNNALPVPGYSIRTFVDPVKHTKTFEIKHNDRFYRVVQPFEIADKREHTRLPTSNTATAASTIGHSKPTITVVENVQIPDNDQSSMLVPQQQPQLVPQEPLQLVPHEQVELAPQQPVAVMMETRVPSNNAAAISIDSQRTPLETSKEIALSALPVKTSQNIIDVVNHQNKQPSNTVTLLESPSTVKENMNFVQPPLLAQPIVAQQLQQTVISELPQPAIELTKQTPDLTQIIFDKKPINTLLGTRKEKVPIVGPSSATYKPTVNYHPVTDITPPTDASATLSREIKGVTSLSSHLKAKKQPTAINDDFTKALNHDIVLK